MDQIEKKLIEKAVKGNHKAYETLILNHENKIYAIAFKIFKNESDAYDVAQEICIKIYNKIGQFNFESSFSTWLYRLATNTAIDAYRKQKRKNSRESSYDAPLERDDNNVSMQIKDSGDTPEEAALRKERVSMVWDALNELKADQKTIIILRDIEEKSYQEICQLLDIGLGTVKSRLARSRNALKNVLLEKREQNLL